MLTAHQSQIHIDLDHFKARLLQDALTQALASHWDHKADIWEAAAPQPGDYTGHATELQLAEAWRRCTLTARACRRHAQLLRQAQPEPISQDVYEVLT